MRAAERRTDAIQLWIIGAGPAGLSLAEACVARGLRVGILAPQARAAWRPNYAMWLDDAVELEVDDYLAQRWTGAVARFAAGSRVLERGYGLLDDRRWQLDLLARVQNAGARIESGTLAAIEHDDEGDPNPYQVEHDELFAAIAAGEFKYADGKLGAIATMTAIMGRMATYSGQVVEWEEALNSELSLMPERFAWDANPPVMPDADGRYAVPAPGVTRAL